ncbi:MAG: tRNA guanosine(34) transglycosylase Tgt [Deltaproteobacteria bacterium]|jgi:queuine tRNA-ribosyltransferase|nr:tRNA guanosine(34) transglycosylase Tgt [Deltaproteobacteria bacterium]
MSDTFTIVFSDPDSNARAGILRTASGEIPTPFFMPVGTRASVKAIGPDDLKACGAKIVLANTFHLLLRPGAELISSFGGIGKFMAWDGPILTDSGGFQIYSLKSLRKITPNGIHFSSPYDGTKFFFTPEKAIETQTLLKTDIMMCLDECTPYPSTYQETATSLELTYNWAKKCHAHWDPTGGQLLFGIVQGGFHADLRQISALQMASLNFPGYATGGLALGEPPELRQMAVEQSFQHLPADKPRYLMGVGTPLDILNSVKQGADMFDCVLPTRNARNGQFFTSQGKINIRNTCYKTDPLPIEENCQCYTCQNFSRSYLRHLFQNREPLFPRLASIHNLFFYLKLMQEIRKHLLQGSFLCYYNQFWDSYSSSLS